MLYCTSIENEIGKILQTRTLYITLPYFQSYTIEKYNTTLVTPNVN